MSVYDYQFKTGSDRPTVRYQFEAVTANDEQLDRDVDVVGATFSMENVSTGTVVVNEADATLVDAGVDETMQSGVVEYQLSPDESTIAGLYVAEFELVYRDGSVRRVPAGRNISIKITGGVA